MAQVSAYFLSPILARDADSYAFQLAARQSVVTEEQAKIAMEEVLRDAQPAMGTHEGAARAFSRVGMLPVQWSSGELGGGSLFLLDPVTQSVAQVVVPRWGDIHSQILGTILKAAQIAGHPLPNVPRVNAEALAEQDFSGLFKMAIDHAPRSQGADILFKDISEGSLVSRMALQQLAKAKEALGCTIDAHATGIDTNELFVPVYLSDNETAQYIPVRMEKDGQKLSSVEMIQELASKIMQLKDLLRPFDSAMGGGSSPSGGGPRT